MDLASFLEKVNRLKEIRRSGWVERGVKEAETVAEHSFTMSLIALVLGLKRKDIDLDRLLKMILVHDLPEAVTGDLIAKEYWNGGHMPKGDIYRLEQKEMKRISEELGLPELLELWEEFEEGKTKEARLARSIDKFEMIHQALEYKKTGNYKKGIDGFWDEKNLSYLKDPELLALAKELIKVAGSKSEKGGNSSPRS